MLRFAVSAFMPNANLDNIPVTTHPSLCFRGSLASHKVGVSHKHIGPNYLFSAVAHLLQGRVKRDTVQQPG